MSHPTQRPGEHPGGHPGGRPDKPNTPRLIAWEVTRSCVLACKHCRAAAQTTPYPDELTTEECYRLLDNIASFAKPIMILTGGEPMLRADIYEIAAYAHKLELPVVMAPCGMLVDDETAIKIKDCGIRRISISLDGATAESHDAFRGVDGAFAGAIAAIEAAKRVGLSFQINTTITQHNLHELAAIRDLSKELGAAVFNPFLLVPTGRGKDLADQEISAEQYEQSLHWLADERDKSEIDIRVTCAPHYQRILRQNGCDVSAHAAKGCMGGQSFAFISHRGKVQICGFLDTECGNVRKADYNFQKIWDTSPVFLQMRDPDGYHGRCGYCEFRKVCGGCRARAFAFTGDYLAEEPFCLYEPKRRPDGKARTASTVAEGMDALDKSILSLIQTDLPIAGRPFDVIADKLDLATNETEVRQRVAGLRRAGIIRRLGAVFDSKQLGYTSTLVAAKVPADQLEQVAARVSQLSGVTHNYRREHDYNLWFTLTVPAEGDIERTLAKLRSQTDIDAFHSLPALGVYKIRVNFQLDGKAAAAAPPPSAPAAAAELTADQKQLVRLIQDDLPLTNEPFALVAEQLGWPAQRVTDQIAAWRAAGVIRRFGAVVRHQRLGFRANGMAVFSLPAEKIDEAGYLLAQRDEVSHCYHRSPLPGFPYALFGMTHGESEQQVRQLADQFASLIDASRHAVLFSTKEYKKVSMRYFLEGT